ncbi:unnamed protein product [[Candida] boidinii]|nr:unnamed protein product [[Candida] boidinii]
MSRAPLVLTKCPILNPHEATLKYIRPEKKKSNHDIHSTNTGLDSPNSISSNRNNKNLAAGGAGAADDDADDESDYDIDTKVCPLMIGDARTLFKEKLARMSIAAITEPSITNSKEGSPKVTSISAEVTTEVNSPLNLSSSSPLKKSKNNLDTGSVTSPSGISTTVNSPQANKCPVSHSSINDSNAVCPVSGASAGASAKMSCIWIIKSINSNFKYR